MNRRIFVTIASLLSLVTAASAATPLKTAAPVEAAAPIICPDWNTPWLLSDWVAAGQSASPQVDRNGNGYVCVKTHYAGARVSYIVSDDATPVLTNAGTTSKK